MGVEEIRRDYPLTFKWRGLIHRFSYQKNFLFNDGLQESLILEWEVSQKIADLKYRENYFKKVLYRRLISIRNNTWEKRKIDLCNENSDETNNDIFDSIICVRPFDTIFFNELIVHISQMLLEIDFIASEIFLLRVKENLRWKMIKELQYVGMPHNCFYNKVSLIKNVVTGEIHNGKC